MIVLRSSQPLLCTPWLSCRFTNPRHWKRCTSVVAIQVWCRSCAWRLTLLYKRRKSQRGPSGRRGINLAEMKDVDKEPGTSTPPSPRRGCSATPSRAFAQQFSAVQQQTEAIQHILPRRDAPTTAAPWVRPQSARRRGRPHATSRAAPPQAESTPRPARRASCRRAAPLCPSQAPSRLGSRRSGPDAGNPEMLEFDLSRETARTPPLLPPEEGREENPIFIFVSVCTHFLKERAISFSSGFSGPWDDNVRRPASSLSSPTHFASSQ